MRSSTARLFNAIWILLTLLGVVIFVGIGRVPALDRWASPLITALCGVNALMMAARVRMERGRWSAGLLGVFALIVGMAVWMVLRIIPLS